MRMLSPERAAALAFFQNWWPRRARAENVLRDWQEIFERKCLRRSDTLALADLARLCNAGDSCFDRDPLRMAANAGRQEVWLAIKARLALTEEDTNTLLEETE